MIGIGIPKFSIFKFFGWVFCQRFVVVRYCCQKGGFRISSYQFTNSEKKQNRLLQFYILFVFTPAFKINCLTFAVCQTKVAGAAVVTTVLTASSTAASDSKAQASGRASLEPHRFVPRRNEVPAPPRCRRRASHWKVPVKH